MLCNTNKINVTIQLLVFSIKNIERVYAGSKIVFNKDKINVIIQLFVFSIKNICRVIDESIIVFSEGNM